MKGIVYCCQAIHKSDFVWSDEIAQGNFSELQINSIFSLSVERNKFDWKKFSNPNHRYFQKLVYAAKLQDQQICGFNSIDFDDNLCAAEGIAIGTDYDLAREIRISAYGSPYIQDQPQDSDYSLEAMILSNIRHFLLYAEAPAMAWSWEERKKRLMSDGFVRVRLIRDLILMAQEENLIDPNTYKKLNIRKLC